MATSGGGGSSREPLSRTTRGGNGAIMQERIPVRIISADTSPEGTGLPGHGLSVPPEDSVIGRASLQHSLYVWEITAGGSGAYVSDVSANVFSL